jgi:hypothetical protein
VNEHCLSRSWIAKAIATGQGVLMESRWVLGGDHYRRVAQFIKLVGIARATLDVVCIKTSESVKRRGVRNYKGL